jgi:flagellin-like protein
MKKDMEKKFIKMNNKGISGVVATVIMIALVLAAVAIVWGVVTNLISTQLEESGSCFNIFGKLTLNSAYTCYNTSNNEFLFSIGIGDIDIEKVVVSISAQGTTKSYTLTGTEADIGLLSYPGRNNLVKIPDKNGGLTYITSEFASKPDSIRISPVIAGTQCEVSDSIQNIESCSLLA